MSSFNNKYKEILDAAESIRKSILEKNIDYISFGGVMPESDSKEIAAVVKIEKAVFDYLVTEGLTFSEIKDRPNLLETTFEGTRYICQKNYTPVETSVTVEQPSVDMNTSDLDLEFEKEEEKEEFKLSYSGTIREADHIDADCISVMSNLHGDVTEMETLSVKYNENDEDIILAGENNIYLYYKGELVDTYHFESEPLPEPEVQNKATYIGASVIDYAEDSKPPEEIRTPISDIVYEKFKIALSHNGYNVDPEEYELVVAPLKLYKKAMSTVPIIATITKNGNRRITKSSYDVYETGKNLVILSIDDFEILIRGTFDANGVFNTIITTTGNSIHQNDTLSVLNKESFGLNTTNRSVNGHPVIYYPSDEGNAFVFVLPLGSQEDEYFLVSSKTDEFCEYMISSSDAFGANRAFVYTSRGTEMTIIPVWNGEYLEVETFEG